MLKIRVRIARLTVSSTAEGLYAGDTGDAKNEKTQRPNAEGCVKQQLRRKHEE